LCGPEGNGSFFTALRASRPGLDSGIARSARGCSDHGETLGFASFATFGLVLELLIVEEQLFSGGEQKLSTTVNTLQHLVLEFH
jgi:hypothetical protein